MPLYHIKSWFVATILVATPSYAANVDNISNDIVAVGIRLQSLVAEFNQDETVSLRQRFATRLADAEIMFLLNDYARASLVLFDLVQDRRYVGQRNYGKAIYYLAEAQYQMGNNLAARNYFQMLVDRRSTTDLTTAIRRLIEIADKTHHWDGLNRYVGVLRAQGTLPPSIAYIHAKSLVRQGRWAEVDKAAADIPQTHPLHAKVTYLSAVGALQTGQLERSAAMFGALIKTSKPYDDAETLRDLSAMNQGRILLELGKLPEAIDSYQHVGRSSPFFDEAMYEITWLFVQAAASTEDEETRNKEYNRALNALDILLLGDSGMTVAPEARILMGNILVRLERYGDATKAFEEVVARYRPVRQELKVLASEVVDPVAYYDQIVARSRTGTALLPPLAVKWAAQGQQLQQALGIVTDIDQSENWVKESEEIVVKLLDILKSENRTQFFPALHTAQARQRELENVLTHLSHRLLDAERQWVQPMLTSTQKTTLDAILQERAILEPAYAKLPRKQEEYKSHLKNVRDDIDAYHKEAFRLQWGIEQMRRTLTGIRQWYAGQPQALTPDQAQTLHDHIAQAEREISQLETEQRTLQKDIARERDSVVITRDAEHEEQVRKRYQANLIRERELLGQAQGQIESTPALAALMDQINTTRSTLHRYHVALENFGRKLNRTAKDKVLDVQSKILKEQTILEQHALDIVTTRDAAKRVVGEIAMESLRGVDTKFQHIVLRGEVGVIDVAWARKEEKTKEISRRVNEQRRELQVLDNEFSSIMGAE